MSKLCLIDIPWETRNLGMPAYQLEGTIKNNKVVESILEKKQTELKDNFFVQLKINAENINESIFSQDAGFKLIELSICPYLDLNLVSSKVGIGLKRICLKRICYYEEKMNFDFNNNQNIGCDVEGPSYRAVGREVEPIDMTSLVDPLS